MPIQTQKKMIAYVGSRTTRERNARGDGITVYEVDQDNGALILVQTVSKLENPSFLALGSSGEYLYTVHGDREEVSSFRISPDDGSLTYLNTQSTGGLNPAHIAINPSGRYAVISNHYAGSVAVLSISEDGTLGPMTDLVTLEGEIGPHRIEQKIAKPHFNPFDPGGKFIVVPDKGLDQIFSFTLDTVTGKLVPTVQRSVGTREGAGPRHIAFHPTMGFAYVVNELDSTVTTYHFNPKTGELNPCQILPSLPENFTGNSRAAEIEVAGQGHFVYASNRGHDSIACYRINQENGFLNFVGAQPTLGKTPRFFAVGPCGKRLYAANEDSDSITIFELDEESGQLTSTGNSVLVGSPVCIVFNPLPG